MDIGRLGGLYTQNFITWKARVAGMNPQGRSELVFGECFGGSQHLTIQVTQYDLGHSICKVAVKGDRGFELER